jgi:phosphatidate cytidylyltransferase
MKQRILTALILVPVVLFLVFATNPLPVFLLGSLCAFLSFYELGKLCGVKSPWLVPIFATLALMTAMLIAKDHYHNTTDRFVGWLGSFFVLGVGGLMVVLKNPRPIKFLAPGLLWIGMPIFSLVSLHYSVEKVQQWYPNPLLMALIPVWAGDTFAILFGKKFGKRLLAPEISPNKTVEGSFAYLAGCLVAAVVTASLIGLTERQGVVIGLAAGILGQAGDLLESAIKRAIGVKDSGSLLPGHGGLLDRIDSMLLPAIPITALILFYR